MVLSDKQSSIEETITSCEDRINKLVLRLPSIKRLSEIMGENPL